MSEWISVEDQPLAICTHQDESGSYYDILTDDLVLMKVPCAGGDFLCVGYISESMQIEDSCGDEIGYHADDVSHWCPLPNEEQKP